MQSRLVNHLIILGTAIIIGLLIALPVLLPPLRRRGKRSERARKTAILVCGLLAFVSTFCAWNYLKAAYAFLWIGLRGGYGEGITNNDAFTTEMWLRESIPPVTRPICYTQDADDCRVADYYAAQSADTLDSPWFNYVFTLVYSLAAGLCSGLWVRLFTRPSLDTAT